MEGGNGLVQVPAIELTTSARESGKFQTVLTMDTLVSLCSMASSQDQYQKSLQKVRTWVAFTVRSCNKASCAAKSEKMDMAKRQRRKYLCIFSPWQNHLRGHASPKFPCDIFEQRPETSSFFALLSSLFSVVSGTIPSTIGLPNLCTELVHLLIPFLHFLISLPLADKVADHRCDPAGLSRLSRLSC